MTPTTVPRRTGRALTVLRAVVALHALAIAGQPVFAGLYLTGDYDMLAWHAAGADAAFYLGIVQLVVAVVLAALGGRRWPAAVALLVAAAETVQYFAGLAGELGLHVPLGVALVAGTVLLVAAVCGPAAAGRHARDATGAGR